MNTWIEDLESALIRITDLDNDCPRCQGRSDCQQCRILPGIVDVLKAHLKSVEQMEPIPEPAPVDDPPTQTTRSAGKVAGAVQQGIH